MKELQESKSLIIPILIGIIAGICLGGFLPNFARSVEFLGKLFINGLSMLIIPLVMTSMIVAVTSLGDIRQLKKIGTKTIIYYLSTTAIAVTLGLIVVNLVQPGVVDNEADRIALRGGQVLENVAYQIENNEITIAGEQFRSGLDERYQVILSDPNQIRGVIKPERNREDNKLTVVAWTDPLGEVVTPQQQGSGLKIDLAIAGKVQGRENRSIGDVLEEMVVGLLPTNIFQAMADNKVLPLIVFSLLFAGVLSTLGEAATPIIRLTNSLNDTFMSMIHLILLAAPVGIGALIAGRLGQAGGFSGFATEFLSLSKFVVAVVLGLAIHALIVLPIILVWIARRPVIDYLKNMLPALTTAFSTASSSATLPLSIECAIENNRVPAPIVNFVLPLGATVNMDGTALYEAVAAVFIAQIYGIELSLGQEILILLTATLAAIGAAGIPQAGLVTLIVVLRTLDLPVEGISLILAIDWFLDRCRTTVNVWGDAVGAAVVERLEPRYNKNGFGKTDKIPEIVNK